MRVFNLNTLSLDTFPPEELAKLEVELVKTLEYERILLVNSGTSSLRLALHLAGARPGTEVIFTPQTCLFTNTAILETC